MDALADRTFRANPGYELVLLDRLPPAQRRLVEAERDGDDLYGVLKPRRGTGLAVRAVSPDTALLFLALAVPGSMPAFARTRLGDRADRTIGRLVVDGVLEVLDDGEFRGGAHAAEIVMPGRPAEGTDRIGELSIAALRYAQELHGLPEPLVASRLYSYGSRPPRPGLRDRLSDAPAVAAHLGISPGGSASAALEAGWLAAPAGSGTPGPADGHVHWLQWRSKTISDSGPGPENMTYKLYVSPGLDVLPRAVEAVLATLAGRHGAFAVKVGADLPGICRPDKIVAYFVHLDDLQRSAARLRERLDGCPAHGVPYTAAITPDGLLSWGADPPRGTDARERTSWRAWVTGRLAEHLTLARADGPAEIEPWRFALKRLRLSGIDTETWVPSAGMWPRALANG